MENYNKKTTSYRNSRSSYPKNVTEEEAVYYVAQLEPRFFNALSKKTRDIWEHLSYQEKYSSLRYQWLKQEAQNKTLASQTKTKKCSIEQHLLKPTSDLTLEGLDEESIVALYSKLSSLANKVMVEITVHRQEIDMIKSLSERRAKLRLENNILMYLISSKNNKDKREYDDDVKLVLTYEEFEKMSQSDFRRRYSSNRRVIASLSEIIKNIKYNV